MIPADEVEDLIKMRLHSRRRTIMEVEKESPSGDQCPVVEIKRT